MFQIGLKNKIAYMMNQIVRMGGLNSFEVLVNFSELAFNEVCNGGNLIRLGGYLF